MRLKKKKNYKTERITFRLTEREYNKILSKALLFTEGNLSEFILYAALNFRLEIEDIEKEAPESASNLSKENH